ncbi:MAG: hypothetical protein IJ326_06500 [Lachnospiraceae bacterium]|nr:hypothetical protein [Lachnospiraceae bacterium]
MREQMKEFVIENYGKKSTFASFLPGISGIHGTPIWCYYVNRGQSVVSFGVDNKDHAIMEFYPAHQAYQNVKTTGFRTFLKVDHQMVEPFADENVFHSMKVAMNGFSIEESNEETGLKTSVQYFSLPGEKVGALVRCVTIENISQEFKSIEVLDGMPAVIPYGVNMDNMKNMAQTAKAWMQVEDLETGIPYFRVRASIADTAVVRAIEGGNFSMAYAEDGSLLKPIVDPELIFAYDSSLRKAVGFENNTLEELYQKDQIVANQLPCSFWGIKRNLKAGEQITIYEMIGQVKNQEALKQFVKAPKNTSFFAAKKREADGYIEEICAGIRCKTASDDFDAYASYTYMDNVLRGGYPIRLGHNKIFYVYSRKHGDIERDYNYFSMLPEYYSQGNGNFRDVNQNRRCDTFFAPFVGRENIKQFYGLLQMDGYNPLGIEKLTYCLSEDKANQLMANMELTDEQRREICALVSKAFTPGELYSCLEELGVEAVETVFCQLIDFAQSMVNGDFKEGYWTDHWTYNLDLIQDYLEVFPEQEEDLLFEKEYTSFVSQVNINPRAARYAETPKGLRQYHALDEKSLRSVEDKIVRKNYGTENIYKMTLLAKLVLLCTTKFATLDAYGMGIEMEGGKPGWYDALNGMPAIFGSSMSETYELCRMLEYTLAVLEKYDREVELPFELAVLLTELDEINRDERVNIKRLRECKNQEIIREQGENLSFWNRINDAKEAYRRTVFKSISGEEKIFSSVRIREILRGFLITVQEGIRKACVLGEGICPTYFTYEVMEYEKTQEGYRPLQFKVNSVPHFLEGPVRFLKLNLDIDEKRRLYQAVKNSDLYDEKLQMYKVNASLQEASYEYGRARAFTPGWLENESIWLHMEYKYLLELLRSGMYQEFFEDFHKAAVPFLDPEVYGRSIYENSSFIASSKNPNKAYHGKGFVARLSGSTIEFISMWKLIMFGKEILSVVDGELCFTPKPCMPSYLIPDDGTVTTTLFGKTELEYHFAKKQDYIPGNYAIQSMAFAYRNGSVATISGTHAGEKLAKDVRDGLVKKVVIHIQ